jgi:hypothetical protein
MTIGIDGIQDLIDAGIVPNSYSGKISKRKLILSIVCVIY